MASKLDQLLLSGLHIAATDDWPVTSSVEVILHHFPMSRRHRFILYVWNLYLNLRLSKTSSTAEAVYDCSTKLQPDILLSCAFFILP